MAKLNDRQKRFCDEYLIDLNATQAAIRAGYSEKTAEQTASRLLTNVKVQEYIEKRKKDRIERTEITQDDVLKELAIIAFSTATDYAEVIEKDLMVEVDGKLIPALDAAGQPIKYKTVEPILTEKLTEEQKKALSVVKSGKFGIEIKPYDKTKALELLGKHLGLFEDRVHLSGEVNNPMANLTTEELRKLAKEADPK